MFHSLIIMQHVTKPKTIEEYELWYNDQLGINLSDDSIKNRYLSNALLVKQTIQESPFFLGLSGRLENWKSEYEEKHHADLFMMETGLDLLTKSYPSVINKSFRINVLENNNWPKPPKRGWVTPENWYSHMNDLLRTTLNCKFIDGPGFLADRLLDYAKTQDMVASSYSHQKDSGYYAFHVYGFISVDLLDQSWNKQSTTCQFELQLTTQLQEIMRGLLHRYYEQTRISPVPKHRRDREKWKWDHNSLLFKSSFLGHTLHLLEGVIVELRDSASKL
jgi:hypothetical protein